VDSNDFPLQASTEDNNHISPAPVLTSRTDANKEITVEDLSLIGELNLQQEQRECERNSRPADEGIQSLSNMPFEQKIWNIVPKKLCVLNLT